MTNPSQGETMLSLPSHFKAERPLHPSQAVLGDQERAEVARLHFAAAGEDKVDVRMGRIAVLPGDPCRQVVTRIGGQLDHRGARESFQVETPSVPGREYESIDASLPSRRPSPVSLLKIPSRSSDVLHELPAFVVSGRTGGIEHLATG
jgi:hypothetical protein